MKINLKIDEFYEFIFIVVHHDLKVILKLCLFSIIALSTCYYIIIWIYKIQIISQPTMFPVEVECDAVVLLLDLLGPDAAGVLVQGVVGGLHVPGDMVSVAS